MIKEYLLLYWSSLDFGFQAKSPKYYQNFKSVFARKTLSIYYFSIFNFMLKVIIAYSSNHLTEQERRIRCCL